MRGSTTARSIEKSIAETNAPRIAEDIGQFACFNCTISSPISSLIREFSYARPISDKNEKDRDSKGSHIPVGPVQLALEMEELVVDAPGPFNLKHSKGVEEHYAEIGFAKAYARSMTGNIARENLKLFHGSRVFGGGLL